VLICGSGVGASVAANKLRGFVLHFVVTPIPGINHANTTIAMFFV
jgi:ribose 5-phosphate isomerase RpiB